MDKESAKAQRDRHWNTVMIPPDQATLPPIIVPRGADDSHPQLLNSAAIHTSSTEKKLIVKPRKQASCNKCRNMRPDLARFVKISRIGYLICNIPGCKREYVTYENFVRHFMNKHT